MKSLHLIVLFGSYAVCRLPADAVLPEWAMAAKGFLSVTRTDDELSIVCKEVYVSKEQQLESGWRIIKVEGPLDFSLTGILAGLAEPLAETGVSIFAVSTYDTDYILVRQAQLSNAISVLRQEGHEVVNLSIDRCDDL